MGLEILSEQEQDSTEVLQDTWNVLFSVKVKVSFKLYNFSVLLEHTQSILYQKGGSLNQMFMIILSEL